MKTSTIIIIAFIIAVIFSPGRRIINFVDEIFSDNVQRQAPSYERRGEDNAASFDYKNPHVPKNMKRERVRRKLKKQVDDGIVDLRGVATTPIRRSIERRLYEESCKKNKSAKTSFIHNEDCKNISNLTSK